MPGFPRSAPIRPSAKLPRWPPIPICWRFRVFWRCRSSERPTSPRTCSGLDEAATVGRASTGARSSGEFRAKPTRDAARNRSARGNGCASAAVAPDRRPGARAAARVPTRVAGGAAARRRGGGGGGSALPVPVASARMAFVSRGPESPGDAVQAGPGGGGGTRASAASSDTALQERTAMGSENAPASARSWQVAPSHDARGALSAVERGRLSSPGRARTWRASWPTSRPIVLTPRVFADRAAVQARRGKWASKRGGARRGGYPRPWAWGCSWGWPSGSQGTSAPADDASRTCGCARRSRCSALVGKGVTFDTGGISIKPAGGMEWMK